MDKNNRVLVGMSGGVDSSVCAALLLEQGYEVSGVTIKPFIDESIYGPEAVDKAMLAVRDARKVCDMLGIEHIVTDYSDYFRNTVMKYFADEYLSGRTPNPCIFCNPKIKWGKLLETATEMGAYYIATGHYARIKEYNGSAVLAKGLDNQKDQSYFLWGLSSGQLSRTLLPLGQLTKSETRELARKYKLPVAEKSESQEVCFIPDNDYHNFLAKFVPGSENAEPGDFIFRQKVIGRHKGLQFYTVGQRKGLGLTYKEPLYVRAINPNNNSIEVGTNTSLYSNELTAADFRLSIILEYEKPIGLDVKVRYRDSGSSAKCTLVQGSDGREKLSIVFDEMKRAITPGQSVVLYLEDMVVGGGIIANI